MGLLRTAIFRRYWLAQTVSLVGDEVTFLALPVFAALTLGATPAQMGYLTAAALLPHLLFSLVAGHLVGRYRHKRRVMIAADLGRAVLLAVIPVLWWAEVLTIQQLWLIAAGTGTCAVLFDVAHSSVFASIVDRPDYVRAHTLVNGSRAAAGVAGPSAGGLLVQVLTAPVALLADVVSYLASAFLMARTPVTATDVGTHDAHDDRHDCDDRAPVGMGAGLRLVFASPVLRPQLLATTTLNLFNYVFGALFVLYATTELGLSPGTLGLALGIGATGGLAGALITGPCVRRFGIGPTFAAGMLLFPGPLLLVPLTELASGPLRVVMIAGAEFLSSVGVMLVDIPGGAISTAAAPASMLSLVQGMRRTVNYGIRPIGAVLGGWLGTLAGLQPAIWVGAAGGLTGFVWVLCSPLARMRDLPEPPDLPPSRERAGGPPAGPGTGWSDDVQPATRLSGTQTAPDWRFAVPASPAVRPLVIAIDGPSGSGKSSVSREVAARLGLEYLDTGAMYRAACWSVLDAGIDPADGPAVAEHVRELPLVMGTDPASPTVVVGGHDIAAAIRETRISSLVSQIATNLEVRAELRRRQQALIEAARTGPKAGCVAEGRDITTVVAPDADVRILLTASEEARLARRARDVHGTDSTDAVEATRDQIVRRDRDDSTVSSFTEAADGVLHLDSSHLDFEQTVHAVLTAVAASAQPDAVGSVDSVRP